MISFKVAVSFYALFASGVLVDFGAAQSSTLPVCESRPLLRQGDGIGGGITPVAQLQEILNVLGDSNDLCVDGQFGGNTKAAVESFQESQGLDVDGIVGPNTFAVLCNLFAVVFVEGTVCETFPTLQRNDGFLSSCKGDLVEEVGELQNILNEINSADLVVDGLFGGGTEAAVKDFQGTVSLTDNGIVELETWTALCNEFKLIVPEDVCEFQPRLELNDGFLSEGKGGLQDEVKQLQEILNTVGNFDLKVDGLFGPNTESAVTTFQAQETITVDGIVETETWTRLCLRLTPQPTDAPSSSPSAAPSFAPSAAPSSMPTVSPSTQSPTDLPTTSPTDSPTRTPAQQDPPQEGKHFFGSVCFSGSATVQVQNQNDPVMMRDLRIGDRVLVKDGDFQPVYSFGHRDTFTETTYLQVKTDLSSIDGLLEISPEHMIYTREEAMASKKLVAAKDLQLGHFLVRHNGASMLIVSITAVNHKGAFAPLTASGSLVVNSVETSAYVSRKWLPKRVSGEALHILQHAGTFPLRTYCFVKGGCKEEEYNKETGFNGWVQFWFDLEQFLLFRVVAGGVLLLMSDPLSVIGMGAGFIVWKKTANFAFSLSTADSDKTCENEKI